MYQKPVLFIYARSSTQHAMRTGDDTANFLPCQNSLSAFAAECRLTLTCPPTRTCFRLSFTSVLATRRLLEIQCSEVFFYFFACHDCISFIFLKTSNLLSLLSRSRVKFIILSVLLFKSNVYELEF